MQIKSLKKSRQREAVYDFLMTRKDHPTADFIYENVRKTFPNISLGTVYRNLNLLVELGQAQRFSTYDGYDHFDGNPAPHYHFVCNKCRCVLDIDTPTDDGLDVVLEADCELALDYRMAIFDYVNNEPDIIRFSFRRKAEEQAEPVVEKLKPVIKIAGFDIYIAAVNA